MTAVNLNRAIRGPVTAVPVVAGKGVRLVADTVNNRFVAEADETVLYNGDAVGQTAFDLSESIMNFETVKVWICSRENSLNPISIVEVPTTTIGSTLFLFTTERFDSSWQWITWRFDYTVSNSGTTLQLAANAYGGSKANNSWGSGGNVMTDVHVYKVIGINRKAST